MRTTSHTALANLMHKLTNQIKRNDMFPIKDFKAQVVRCGCSLCYSYAYKTNRRNFRNRRVEYGKKDKQIK